MMAYKLNLPWKLLIHDQKHKSPGRIGHTLCLHGTCCSKNNSFMIQVFRFADKYYLYTKFNNKENEGTCLYFFNTSGLLQKLHCSPSLSGKSRLAVVQTVQRVVIK